MAGNPLMFSPDRGGESTDGSLRGTVPSQPDLREASRLADGRSTYVVSGIELLILDIDDTLALPQSEHLGALRRLQQQALERALGAETGLNPAEARAVADLYRREHGGGEFAFLDPLVHERLPVGTRRAGAPALLRAARLWDELAAIEPAPFFIRAPDTVDHLTALRSHVRIAAITDSPEPLSRRILSAIGLNPDTDFDLYLPWQRDDAGPPKRTRGSAPFAEIAARLGIPHDRILAIGDTPRFDLDPAARIGMKTLHLGPGSQPLVTSVLQIAFRPGDLTVAEAAAP